MKVFIQKDNKTIEIEGKKSVKKVLQQLDINPETVLVVRDGELLTQDTILEENDEIEVISVISGG